MFRDIIEYIFFGFLVIFIRILPLFLVRRVAVIISYFLFYGIGYRKKVMMENLKNAFPEKSPKELKKIAFGSIKSFFICMLEVLWLPNLSRKKLFNICKFKNPEVLESVLKKNKGIILITGHFGNWEYLGHAVASKYNKPFPAIAKAMRNKYVNNYLEKVRQKFGNYPAYMDTGIKDFYKTLLSGGIVAMVADQSAPQESIYINFFGRPASTFQGPAVFSLKSKASVLFTLAIRDKNYNYDIIFEEIDYSDIQKFNDDNIFEFTRRHVELLEKYIRMYPDQWLWSHKRWKHSDKYEIFGKRNT
jgi:Kdo2-lipid IVA lauroyltransferase/acyltransferase